MDMRRPELNTWFKNLKNRAGVRCCDDGEAQHVEAVVGHDQGGIQGLVEASSQANRTGAVVRRAVLRRA